MKVCFVVGMEDTKDYPGDTPEAYWRVLLPSRRYGSAVIVGQAGAAEKATSADVVWIYEPTCYAAAALAEVARQMGKPVVVDFSEDIWRREEQGQPYSAARIEAAEKALAAATLIVCANAKLAEVYAEHGRTAVLETVLPLEDQAPGNPEVPPSLVWWSDGRQKAGFEAVAPALVAVMVRTGCGMVHIQFAHQKPLVAGLSEEASRARASKMHAYFMNDLTQTAEANLKVFRGALARAALNLDCYYPGAYAESVSDVPLLRAAALGVPTVTTRSEAPPGAISARPSEWADTILGVLEDPGKRRGLSLAARSWAETRSTHEGYDALIKEVLR